jgi:hypothetical protein
LVAPPGLERDVVTLRGRAVVLSLLVAPACFDVDSVDPGMVAVDDFDDGDFVPTMPEFVYWECYAFNPSTNRDYGCDHTDGYMSRYSLFVEFSLQDPPDGVQQYPGAGLTMFSNGTPADLTRYHDLIISMRLQSGSPPIPSEARVYVELDCKTVESESGAPVSDFYLTLSVKPSSNWSTYKLALANWAPPPWQTEHIKGGIPACLRAIDGISIALSGELQDGESGSGTLFVDGLKLQ